MKRDCPKRQKDMRVGKPSVAGVVEGSHQGDSGDVFLATAESPG